MATSVKIADELPRSDTQQSRGRSTGISSGVYATRAFSAHSQERRSTWRRTTSFDRRSTGQQSVDTEDEAGGLRQAGDYKQRQVFTGKTLAWLAYQSIGVIYGDIGTSPLYVYSSTFTSPPSYDNLLGVLSIILWSLSIMVTIKYVFIILRADNEGEGGTFSCYSLLSRYANITNRDPREASLIKMERWKSGDLQGGTRKFRGKLEHSKFARGLLKTIGALAVSMVMSDGVLTPAQSVLGAVQGIEVVNPNITKPIIIGTTCGILILLFLIQPFGTTKIATAFAPIVIIWLGFNAAFGIYNLANFDHSVLKAFNPAYAFEFLIREGEQGWRMLGGVLLAFTGVEALFADLGAFSRRAILLSWLCYTYPCLLLAYIGQAAYISVHPDAYTNPFFNAAPPGTLYPALIAAILAAIVASQAIITATFQLMAQIMKLSYFPQIKVVHTSRIFFGQLYVPLVNWLLMVGTVLVAAIYNNTTSLGNAYGVCVMFVTFFDTCMVSIVALIVWRIHPALVFFPWLIIASHDGVYLSSALTKVPSGAWFTITLAGILASLFILWRFGKEQQWAAEAEDRFPTTHFIQKRPNEEGKLVLTAKYGGEQLNVVKGFGIFFDKAGETTPVVYSQFIRKLLTAPEVSVFFHLRPLEVPTVSAEEKYTVSKLPLPNTYRLVVRYGFTDRVISRDLHILVYGQVRDFILRQAGREHIVSSIDPVGAQQRDISILEARLNSSGQDGAPLSSQSTISEKPAYGISEETKDGAIVAPPPIERETKSKSAEIQAHMKEALPVNEMLNALDEAYRHQVLYIIGKEQMKISSTASIPRKILLRMFLWIRENTRSKVADLRVDQERVVEMGFVKDI